MNTTWARICAATILLTPSSTLATDLAKAGKAVPNENQGIQEQTSLDAERLKEMRNILGQINNELKNLDSDVRVETTTIEHTTVAEEQQEFSLNAYKTLQISYEGDVEMQCNELSVEAEVMRDLIYATQEIKDRAKMRKTGIKAAGALGSFLIGSVTGGVGLAVGGFLLDQGVDQTRSNADIFQDTAEQRRTLMMGIYNAKGCFGPLDHAMQNPEIFDPIPSIEITAANMRDDYQFNQ